MVKMPDYQEVVAKAHTMILRADSMQTFVTGMFLYDSLYRSGSKVMRLVLPYVPGARQDRINEGGDVLFTVASVARMLNDRNFEDIIVADPHSPVTEAYINQAYAYPLERIYDKLWKGYGGVIAPDKGAKHRAEVAHSVIGGELRYGGKVRDTSTGRLTGFTVEDLTPGTHYVVVDDICDGGGTFVGLGEKIREAGAYADLFVTHGIFAKGTRDLRRYFKNIYTTDSYHVGIRERIETNVLRIVEDMVNY